MCGLFGALGEAVTREMITACAMQASRRGPNAWGVASFVYGRLSAYRQPGLLSQQLRTLNEVIPDGSSHLIGQSRLATSGTYHENANNPPITVGDVALAHNGNVYNAKALTDRYSLRLKTNCDSEVIAHLLSLRQGTLLERVVWAVEQVDRRSPLGLLVMDATSLVAVRRWQPLYQQGETSVYLCSRPYGDDAHLLADNTVFSWSAASPLTVQQRRIT